MTIQYTFVISGAFKHRNQFSESVLKGLVLLVLECCKRD